VHSIFGAFGLNASILDAANLAWKMGLCCRNKAAIETLMPSYDRERRLHAANIIHVSGTYLRYACNSDEPVPQLHHLGADLGKEAVERSIRGKVSGIVPPGTPIPSHLFLPDFFMRYGAFLLGIDVAYGPSILTPGYQANSPRPPVTVGNGVRAPNPRVCFNASSSGYLYDKMTGACVFHILVFALDLHESVQEKLKNFSTSLAKGGFYKQYGGPELFNIVLIVKCLPFEIKDKMSGPDLHALRERAVIVFDDRAPDEDAHTTWGVNRATGAVVVVRPDLWVGMSVFPDQVEELDEYFGGFLRPEAEATTTGELTERLDGLSTKSIGENLPLGLAKTHSRQ
jgi:phenol 2-monooxygenase (NADPH)